MLHIVLLFYIKLTISKMVGMPSIFVFLQNKSISYGVYTL
jgi:hypothetical protein